MAKQLQRMERERGMFSLIEMQIKRQEEQGKTIQMMFDRMKSMYDEISEKFSTMETMVQEVRDSVTLTNAECFKLLSAVAAKSIQLTKDRFEEGEEPFKKVVGKYRRMIWKALKQTYNVPKYNCIRRIDFESAMMFVQAFRPETDAA
jgi:hypothetical protein